MRIFRTPAYQYVRELLDDPSSATPRDLAATLRDIRRANIFGLGSWVVKHHLRGLLHDVPLDTPVRVLDLATGSGDIPEEICRWARREGRFVSLVIADISELILRIARQRISRAGFGDRVTCAVCDATRVPFADKSFDVTICSLAFHHLDRQQAQQATGEMHRLSRIGFIVNDVYRARGAWFMAWLLTRFTTNSKLTRHDGPASVLKAYTPVELRRISASAGVRARIYTHPFWRMALVGDARSQKSEIRNQKIATSS